MSGDVSLSGGIAQVVEDELLRQAFNSPEYRGVLATHDDSDVLPYTRAPTPARFCAPDRCARRAKVGSDAQTLPDENDKGDQGPMGGHPESTRHTRKHAHSQGGRHVDSRAQTGTQTGMRARSRTCERTSASTTRARAHPTQATLQSASRFSPHRRISCLSALASRDCARDSARRPQAWSTRHLLGSIRPRAVGTRRNSPDWGFQSRTAVAARWCYIGTI